MRNTRSSGNPTASADELAVRFVAICYTSIKAYHDSQEHLSPSDIQTTMWRKFILTARGLQTPKEAALVGVDDILAEPAGVSS